MRARINYMLVFVLLLGLSAVWCQARAADSRPPFPELTGLVVDQAGLLSASAGAQLAEELRGYERGTSRQVVVVTLKTLNGYPIEQYGYQLGRHWGIGQKGKDNGALLLVDYGEREVRIEVGYGLEGTLTDALSSNIIRNVIVPRFKAGQYQAGIIDGTHAILKALGGHYKPVEKHERRGHALNIILMLLVFGFGFVPIMLGRFGRGGRGRRWGGYYGGFGVGGFGGGGFGGGGFGGGGGFSGGGGSFGGGGASGGW